MAAIPGAQEWPGQAGAGHDGFSRIVPLGFGPVRSPADGMSLYDWSDSTNTIQCRLNVPAVRRGFACSGQGYLSALLQRADGAAVCGAILSPGAGHVQPRTFRGDVDCAS